MKPLEVLADNGWEIKHTAGEYVVIDDGTPVGFGLTPLKAIGDACEFIHGGNEYVETEDGLLKFISLLNEVCNAWESLEGGKEYSSNQIKQWLQWDMKPIIDKIRKELNRDIPK